MEAAALDELEGQSGLFELLLAASFQEGADVGCVLRPVLVVRQNLEREEVGARRDWHDKTGQQLERISLTDNLLLDS